MFGSKYLRAQAARLLAVNSRDHRCQVQSCADRNGGRSQPLGRWTRRHRSASVERCVTQLHGKPLWNVHCQGRGLEWPTTNLNGRQRRRRASESHTLNRRRLRCLPLHRGRPLVLRPGEHSRVYREPVQVSRAARSEAWGKKSPATVGLNDRDPGVSQPSWISSHRCAPKKSPKRGSIARN